ncbi:MAG: sulfite exporter TauE/SafE family protein, partial [Beijerinckiaceae bacterium]|nr:sulfite exporter TauE/SafE family protein [Beijerinckiaceae bacterium]
IIPTSIASFRAHKARGTVDMDILRAWAVPVVIGTIIGALLARWAPPAVFKIVFVMVAGINAARLIGNLNWKLGDDLPKGPLMRVYGFFTGIFSALMGIGGGQISTMLMTFHNRPIHQAVSTSAGMGVLISIPGALGYMVSGYGKVGLPPLSIGFVSLIGFLLFAPISIWTAPFGVKLAHAMSKRKLELAFGFFLLLVSLRFLASLLGF